MIPVQIFIICCPTLFKHYKHKITKIWLQKIFHNTAELCAAILDKGISVQLKRGLGRDYLPKSESLSTLQGRLNISESIENFRLC